MVKSNQYPEMVQSYNVIARQNLNNKNECSWSTKFSFFYDSYAPNQLNMLMNYIP